MTWGDDRRRVLRRNARRDQPRRRLRRRAQPPAPRRSAASARPPLDDADAPGAARRGAAGAARSARRSTARACSRSTCRRRCSSSSAAATRASSRRSARPAPTISCTPSAAPPGSRFDPERDDAAVAARAHASRRSTPSRSASARTSSATAARATSSRDPSPRVVLIEGVGLVSVGRTLKAARLARDLYQRAIAVMRGASALGGFVSLDDEESFAIEYWPLELYKLSLAPPPREFQGVVALITGGAGGIGSAAAHAFVDRGRLRRRRRHRQRGSRRASPPRSASAAIAVDADVTDEASVVAAYRAAALAFGGVDVVISNAGIASSAPITETTRRDVGPQPRHPRPRLLPRRPRGRPDADRSGDRRQHHLRRLEERARAEQGRGGVLGREGGRAASRPLPRRGARRARDPRQHGQPRRGARGLADLGLALARGARARLRHRARRARGATTATARR